MIKPTDFARRLRNLGMTQVMLRAWISELTGRPMPQRKTSDWARGQHMPPVEVDALLAVVERPERLERLYQMIRARLKAGAKPNDGS